jgi:sporadic carbohydrate cluster 2OG-Fe(II) oxygenase
MKKYLKYSFRDTALLSDLTSTLVTNWLERRGESACIPCIKLEELHMHLPAEDVNEFRLASMQVINKHDWKDILFTNCFHEACKLLGPDLLIQRKINLSVQMPGDTASILPAHSDCSSGDSPFELVIWIPLTAAFGTNSMFIFGCSESRIFYDNVKKGVGNTLEPKEEDFIEAWLGEYIIFSPSLIHGNALNKTDNTRVSLNIRIKSLFSPYTPYVVSDRTFGTYYDIWKLSPFCLWAKEVYEVLK